MEQASSARDSKMDDLINDLSLKAERIISF